jgi:hypothetical protein
MCTADRRVSNTIMHPFCIALSRTRHARGARMAQDAILYAIGEYHAWRMYRAQDEQEARQEALYNECMRSARARATL